MGKCIGMGRLHSSRVLRPGTLRRSRGLHGEPLEARRLLAAAPELLLDINDVSVSSNPGYIVDINGIAYFRADDGLSGEELWRSDGTEAGTHLVADIVPGPEGSDAFPLGALGNSILFTARDTNNTEALWKSDGTQAGTVKLRDMKVREGTYYDGFNSGVELGNEFFFVSGYGYSSVEGGVGSELWKTDGTTAGTVIVKDIEPGIRGSDPYNLTLVGDEIFFSADDGIHGSELWKTDGTETGTVLVKDIVPGPAGSIFTYHSPDGGYFGRFSRPSLAEFNGELYFSAIDAEHGRELWKSDGTEAGTQLVVDLNPGPAFGLSAGYLLLGVPTQTGIVQLRAAGESLYFIAQPEPDGEQQLWSTDGTLSGTQRVKDSPALGWSGFYDLSWTQLKERDGELFFVAGNPFYGIPQQLWHVDGTNGLAEEVHTFPQGEVVLFTTPTENSLFTLTTSTNDFGDGLTVWATDLASSNTVEIIASESVGFPAAVGDRLFFTEVSDQFGRELWTTDGTLAGTRMVADIGSVTYPSNPDNFQVAGGQLFFTAEGHETPRELWVSDGTTAGTRPVQGLQPGETGAVGAGFTQLVAGPGGLLYTANDSLWRSDGTDSGTFALGGLGVGEITFFDDRLFFRAYDSEYGSELWVSDGTTAGTHRFADIVTGLSSSSPSYLTVLGDWLYFLTRERTIWRTDGTPEGTELFVDESFSYISVEGDRLFFTQYGNESELWISDGTLAGTYMLPDVEIEGGSYAPRILGAVDGSYILHANRSTDRQLYVSDGTAGGTELLLTLEPGQPQYHKVAEIDEKLYFATLDELWVSDGTPQGTQAIADLAVKEVAVLFVEDGETIMYFPAETADGTASGLWRSDGTSAGTYLVDEAEVTGFIFSGSVRHSAFNDSLFYARIDPQVGSEVFRFAPNGPNVAPQVNITVPAQVIRDYQHSIVLTATDFLPDEVAGFTWRVDWDLDGVADETFFGGSQVSLTHTFAESDSPTFQVWAEDQAGGISEMVQASVEIVSFALLPDAIDPTVTNLVYHGTPGADVVFFLPAGPGNVLIFSQIQNGAVVGQLDRVSGITGRVIAHTEGSSETAGNDVFVAEFLSIDVEFHGGNENDVLVGGLGNDSIFGGGGDDILLGGTRSLDGHDFLSGGDGRDLLFGHLGGDTLDGGDDEDLLVGAPISFTSTPNAVYAIQAEWLSERDYATRVANLMGIGTGPRLNGNTFLAPGVTIFDDGSADTLSGGAELDWYLYNFFEDSVGEIETGEEETDLFGT